MFDKKGNMLALYHDLRMYWLSVRWKKTLSKVLMHFLEYRLEERLLLSPEHRQRETNTEHAHILKEYLKILTSIGKSKSNFLRKVVRNREQESLEWLLA